MVLRPSHLSSSDSLRLLCWYRLDSVETMKLFSTYNIAGSLGIFSGILFLFFSYPHITQLQELYPIASALMITGGALFIAFGYTGLEPLSDFAWFWYNVENPPNEQPFTYFSIWFILLTSAIALAVVIIGYFVIISIQNQLLPYCSPTNMSQTCQTLRNLINN